MKIARWMLIMLAPVLSAQDGSSLASRVLRLEDTEAIRTVLTNYGRYLDARDFQSYSRLFAQDGEWSGGLGTVKGPPEIQVFMEKNIGSPNRAHNYHLLSNFVIDVHGDKATAWSRWAFVVPNADGKPAVAQGGHYEDTLVRESGIWKFQKRTAFSDVPLSRPAQTK